MFEFIRCDPGLNRELLLGLCGVRYGIYRCCTNEQVLRLTGMLTRLTCLIS